MATASPDCLVILARLLQKAVANDTAYAARYDLVLGALQEARHCGLEAGIGIDTQGGPEMDGYRVVVYIELPTGQISWHMPEHPNGWDGHTTPEKFERVAAFAALNTGRRSH